MSVCTLEILRDPSLVAARGRWFDRLRGLYAGQRQATAFVLHGIQRYTEDAGADWERWLDEALDELASEPRLRQEPPPQPSPVQITGEGVNAPIPNFPIP